MYEITRTIGMDGTVMFVNEKIYKRKEEIMAEVASHY